MVFSIELFGICAVAGLMFWVYSWSEKCSLANRVAYYGAHDLRCRLQVQYLSQIVENRQSHEDERGQMWFMDVLPYEDEDYKAHYLKRIQTDVNIDDHISIYMKKYNMWLQYEDSFDCETLRTRMSVYSCYPDGKQKGLIMDPYSFNGERYLLKN